MTLQTQFTAVTTFILLGASLCLGQVRAREDRPEAGRAISPYISLAGNFTFIQQSDLTSPVGDIDAFLRDNNAEVNFRTGGGVVAALGVEAHRILPGLRGEVEYAYREADMDEFRIAGMTANAAGEVAMHAVMGNVAYDFDIGRTPLRPYVGGGAGIIFYRGGLEESIVAGQPFGFGRGGDNAFAYQAFAGLGYEVTEGQFIFIGYRYIDGGSPDLGDVTADIIAHNIEFGFRIRF